MNTNLDYSSNFKSDSDGIFKDDGHTGKGPLGTRVLQQQWVTLTASMWPEPTASPRGWKISAERLPVLVAVFCGAAVVVCLLCALVLYKCCVMPRKDKHFFAASKLDPKSPNSQSTPIPGQTAIYAERKGNNWGYSNRLIAPAEQGGPWYIPRIISGSNAQQCSGCPGICPVDPRNCHKPGGSNTRSSNRKQQQRPVSQPIQFVNDNGEILPGNLPLPEVCEFSVNQYASSSILDEVDKDNTASGASLKTRSLPAWVRSKQRPLSTEDDLNDLYAKVNFSKKRKNRMRNDEAAIIALSKSRSQYLNKDTESLVDNEAVIVYDERTAL